jgi:phosphomannomutase
VERLSFDQAHIDSVLALPAVDLEAVKAKGFKVVVDAVNSVGGTVIPALLEQMGAEVIKINCEPTGNFAHNPEPIPANLTEICEVVRREKADLGVVVDPDVDRLALVCEDGEMFGEEYTLVACADYILSRNGGGNTVSNLSSTRALREVTESYGGKYSASAVGEVNVVAKMKEVGAIIGGEGNGGVIYPELHYGRDALVGVALFLSLLAHKGCKVSELKASYPQFHISKNKIQLTPDIDVDKVLYAMQNRYTDYDVTDIDGVKIDFPTEWVHLRKSNTEPIIRIYSESRDEDSAERLARGIMEEIGDIVKGR